MDEYVNTKEAIIILNYEAFTQFLLILRHVFASNNTSTIFIKLIHKNKLAINRIKMLLHFKYQIPKSICSLLLFSLNNTKVNLSSLVVI